MTRVLKSSMFSYMQSMGWAREIARAIFLTIKPNQSGSAVWADDHLAAMTDTNLPPRFDCTKSDWLRRVLAGPYSTDIEPATAAPVIR